MKAATRTATRTANLRPRPAIFPAVLAAGLLVIGVWVVGSMAVPASATEEPEPTEVTEEVAETFDGAEPAVVVEDDEGLEVEPAWTFRYLVPTFLALMLLGVAATVFRWIRMRSRYKIVE